jgi:hypothetical protein
MSEFMYPKSPAESGMSSLAGGLVEMRRMFHAAEPAFHHPARSPTRGSGLGCWATARVATRAPAVTRIAAADWRRITVFLWVRCGLEIRPVGGLA